MKRIALAVLVLTAACKKAPEKEAELVPTREVVAGTAMIDFESPEAKFACRLPGEWGAYPAKYVKPETGVLLRGPNAAWLSISRYPAGDPQWTDAEKYAASVWLLDMDRKRRGVTKEKVGENTVLRTERLRMPYPKRTRNDDKPDREVIVLVPIPGGFYSIDLTAPDATADKYLPILDAVVRSFKPKG